MPLTLQHIHHLCHRQSNHLPAQMYQRLALRQRRLTQANPRFSVKSNRKHLRQWRLKQTMNRSPQHCHLPSLTHSKQSANQLRLLRHRCSARPANRARLHPNHLPANLLRARKQTRLIDQRHAAFSVQRIHRKLNNQRHPLKASQPTTGKTP